MLMKTIWLLRRSLSEIQLVALLLFHYQCLWWNCCLSIRAWGLAANQRTANSTHRASVRASGHATTILFNCDKNLQWIQTVGFVIPVFISIAPCAQFAVTRLSLISWTTQTQRQRAKEKERTRFVCRVFCIHYFLCYTWVFEMLAGIEY